jgi:phosphoribosylglycinamide formyltransferase-1
VTFAKVLMTKRIAVLISGRGSNMEALIDAASVSGYPAKVVGVISNVADAPGLRSAASQGIETAVIDHRRFASRAKFEEKLHQRLTAWNVDLVCLAGFMRILSRYFIERWPDKIVNIHPSLLPDYPGLDVHKRVYENRETYSGCTVHYVREEIDFGPGIVQARIPIEGLKPDGIAARVLEFEHLIYPLAVHLICGGLIEVLDEKVIFRGQRGRHISTLDGGYNALIKIDAKYKHQVTQKSSALSNVRVEALVA